MIFIEIILVIVGLTAVVLSFKASDRREEKPDETLPDRPDPGQAVFDGKEFDILRERMDQYKDEVLEAASDELSRLSNEKILGMDEYSSQVLDRMNKNHEEVVFLYNMLVEKDNEIKDLVHHVDSVKAQIHDETAQEYQNMIDMLQKLKESRIVAEQAADSGQTDGELVFGGIPVHEGETGVSGGISIEKTQAGHLAESAREMRHQEHGGSLKEEDSDKEADKQPEAPVPGKKKRPSGKKAPDNHNEKIIALYKQGNSVLEISKMLSLGQGEVRFVIDLYESRSG